MTLIGSIIIASGLKVVFNSIQSQVFLFLLLIFSVLNIVIGFKLREENKWCNRIYLNMNDFLKI